MIDDVTVIPLLDELMANAWPPAIVEHRSGWRLRWTHGLTRRACSALAVGGTEALAEQVADAEAFYAAHGGPALFQVSEASAPAALAPYLIDRGYVAADRTEVVHVATDAVIAATAPGAWTVETTDRATDAWFDAYWSVESVRGRADADIAVFRRVLLSPSLPAAFVALVEDDRVVATGQVVVEQGWAGVQCMTTVAAHRRRGAASAVLHHLALEAAARGADRMYLAVMADNAGASALYRRAGFTPSHAYRYFTAPA